ncbi:hypothetical protein J6590_062368 [Homalodisca vitripennis]|nr:hypothetical protein J6590_062368 [Homalodisca vitripennis]
MTSRSRYDAVLQKRVVQDLQSDPPTREVFTRGCTVVIQRGGRALVCARVSAQLVFTPRLRTATTPLRNFTSVRDRPVTQFPLLLLTLATILQFQYSGTPLFMDCAYAKESGPSYGNICLD